jgi:hypothetical protein
MIDTINDIKVQLGASVQAKYNSAIAENKVIISTFFRYYDGDHISLFLKRMPAGGYILTDGGLLANRIFFEYFCNFDIHLEEENYRKLIKPYCEEFQVIENGELMIEINQLTELADSYARLIQLMITIYAISEELLEDIKI